MLRNSLILRGGTEATARDTATTGAGTCWRVLEPRRHYFKPNRATGFESSAGPSDMTNERRKADSSASLRNDNKGRCGMTSKRRWPKRSVGLGQRHAVAHIRAAQPEDHVLGDVGCVVGGAFQVAPDDDGVERLLEIGRAHV